MHDLSLRFCSAVSVHIIIGCMFFEEAVNYDD